MPITRNCCWQRIPLFTRIFKSKKILRQSNPRSCSPRNCRNRHTAASGLAYDELQFRGSDCTATPFTCTQFLFFLSVFLVVRKCMSYYQSAYMRLSRRFSSPCVRINRRMQSNSRCNQSETHRSGFDSSAVLSVASMQAAWVSRARLPSRLPSSSPLQKQFIVEFSAGKKR